MLTTKVRDGQGWSANPSKEGQERLIEMLVSRMTASGGYCVSVAWSNLFYCSTRSRSSSVRQTNHLCLAVLGMLP